ncbi:Protein tyrosine phosphatase domain-containing protein 1 [Eumeta japonica]|uniref:Protein tyrosine phosphatase domain-containing protein 1 n=1 Tax=Eumeta variegata TaxID=151549 RepID=A0A4C1WW89_EUMVA|nr:Protein tyrosine phosphatase domain-containing protein 1 [Eumeta japonica]
MNVGRRYALSLKERAYPLKDRQRTGDCSELRISMGDGDQSKESRKRINHPPPPQYSALGEKLRLRTPAALQCALFCGGSRCQYEQPHQATKTAIQGLYSDW